METVYGKAFLTIAAAASDSCDGGLFYPRSCVLDFRKSKLFGNKNDQRVTAFIPGPTRAAKDEPLHSRAWALQERVLSQRVLTYSLGGIAFQCAEGKENILTNSNEVMHRIHRYRLPGPPSEPPVSHWNILVTSFCSRDLTNPRDKLPAIAGLARRYHKLTKGKNGRYLAGLWENHLEAGILWRRSEDLFGEMFRNVIIGTAKSYRAPSWSWAAIDGIVSYLVAVGARHDQTKIIECTTELATADPFSSVLVGKLRISGLCKRATGILPGDLPVVVVDASHGQTIIAQVWLDSDDAATIQMIKDMGHVYCLLVTEKYGLCLTEAPGVEGHYIRIGIFYSSWCSWDDAVHTTMTII
jgi:hypothetical protein